MSPHVTLGLAFGALVIIHLDSILIGTHTSCYSCFSSIIIRQQITVSRDPNVSWLEIGPLSYRFCLQDLFLLLHFQQDVGYFEAFFDTLEVIISRIQNIPAYFSFISQFYLCL